MSEGRIPMGEERSCSGEERLVQLRVRERRAPADAEGRPTRRDFLSLMGFSVGAAGLAACKSPVRHALPLTSTSDQIVPGVANYYATTCGGCPSACSLLVKQRDGRPIKIEGNAEHPLFGNGTCAVGQATVLSLYDDERLRGPLWQNRPASWREVDTRVSAALQAARQNKSKVVLLSGTVTGPSTRQIVSELADKIPGFRHVVYEPVSFAALRAAHAQAFDRPVVPHYAFDRARVVVALEADFLGTWLSPVEFARQYAKARRPENAGCTHIQFESGVSITGTNADRRHQVAPSDLGAVALALLARIAPRAGAGTVADAVDPIDSGALDEVADALFTHRGESLVVSGSNDVGIQTLIATLNALLGNVGKTVDLATASLQRQGDDAAMATLVEEMTRGEIHTLILYGVNPAYDYAEPDRFVRALEQVTLSVSFADRRDETSLHVHAVCPDHHFLESWGDAEPVTGHLGLRQPAIAPLFDTRAAPESLLRWIGNEIDHYGYVRAYWQNHVFTKQKEIDRFDAFWDKSLERGFAILSAPSAPAPTFHGDWQGAARAIATQTKEAHVERRGDRYELHLYESVGLRDGRQANNPWLQEMPDPLTKVTWGNVAMVAPALAQKLALTNGDVVSLDVNGTSLEAPVFVLPGQEPRTISLAVGYGRHQAGRAANGVGVNAFPLATVGHGFRRYAGANVAIVKTGRQATLAASQTHFSSEERPIVEEIAAEELHGDPTNGEHHETLPTLWSEHQKGEHSWGMAIDLNACIGCSACVVACQAENNVPVVGHEQVQRNRIMHWIRIDRYEAAESGQSLHQPMMCQHCQNAPCETVCPVLATTTSSEGLNQQVYNRCIGTRYCANNCPYKVRKFNWYDFTDSARFDFTMANPVARMVLNPDVTVRTRGVMEKCSLCVQRIQLGKNTALKRRTPIADGDIQTACEQACPTQAIVFGDLLDPKSRVSEVTRSRRAYQVLEDLGTRPNVAYLKKVRHARGT